MIEIAAVISAIISHWEDFWIIISLLLINGTVAFFQEHKADNAINLLKQKLAIRSRVLRDGKWVELASKELVPGDDIQNSRLKNMLFFSDTSSYMTEFSPALVC